MTEVGSIFIYNMKSSEFQTMFKDERKIYRHWFWVSTHWFLQLQRLPWSFPKNNDFQLPSRPQPSWVWNCIVHDHRLMMMVSLEREQCTPSQDSGSYPHQARWYCPGFWQLRDVSQSGTVPGRTYLFLFTSGPTVQGMCFPPGDSQLSSTSLQM